MFRSRALGPYLLSSRPLFHGAPALTPQGAHAGAHRASGLHLREDSWRATFCVNTQSFTFRALPWYNVCLTPPPNFYLVYLLACCVFRSRTLGPYLLSSRPMSHGALCARIALTRAHWRRSQSLALALAPLRSLVRLHHSRPLTLCFPPAPSPSPLID